MPPPSRRWMVWMATGVFVLTFVYRFATLGGALGGFDDDHSMQLAYARQVQAGERPGREFLGVSLQGVWPPLGFLASAAAQDLFGDNLRSEALLTTGAMGAGAVVTLLAAVRLAPAPWALLMTALSVLLAPKLYAFPKVIVLSTAALLIVLYARRPSLRYASALGALMTVAFLFRHDYMVYVGVGALTVFAGTAWSNATRAAWHALACAVVALVLVSPSLWYVHQHGGLAPYFELVRVNLGAETARTTLVTLPHFDSFEEAEENAAVWLYWMVQALPVLAVLGLFGKAQPRERWQQVAIVAMAVMTATSVWFLLRANPSARLGDVGPVAAVLGAVVCGGALRSASNARRVVRVVTVVVFLGASILAVWVVGGVSSELTTLGWPRLPHGAVLRALSVSDELAGLPAAAWNDPEQRPGLLASRYINQCTEPRDRLLLLSYEPEVLYFSGRLFAGGVASLVIAGNTPANDEFVLARLMGQAVPIVLAAPEQAQFLTSTVSDYFPRVLAYLQEAYREAGTIGSGDARLHVLVFRNRVAVGTYAGTNLPCFR